MEVLQAELVTPAFWLSVLNVIWVDILLSGDNALVIAMACRNLPGKQRLYGMILGAGAAVLLRIFCAGVITSIMLIPYLKIAGGIALLMVAVKMLQPEDDPETEAVEGMPASLLGAVWTVLVADAVMSLDNVIAIAAIAKGSLALLAIGLIVSIPLIVGGAALIVNVLNKYPVLIWMGGGFLGWIAGGVIVTDPVWPHPALSEIYIANIAGVVAVFSFGVLGRWWHEAHA